VREEVESMRIGDKIDSNHSVEIKLKGGRTNNEGGKRKKKWRDIWDEEGRKEFKRRIGRMEELKEGSIEEQWKEVKKKLKKAVREVEEERMGEKKEGRRGGWWDEECKEEKRE